MKLSSKVLLIILNQPKRLKMSDIIDETSKELRLINIQWLTDWKFLSAISISHSAYTN